LLISKTAPYKSARTKHFQVFANIFCFYRGLI
jgi:hypothetical protein